MKFEKMLETLEELYDAIQLASQSASGLKCDSPEDAAELYNYSHMIKSSVANLNEIIQDKLIEVSEGSSTTFVVPGGVIEVKQGSPRKAWNHRELADVVARRIYERSVDLETGQVTMSHEEMMKEILKFTGISYWRVSELNNINVDADNYCETGEPKTSVILRRES